MYLKISLCFILFILIIIFFLQVCQIEKVESFSDYHKCRKDGLSKEFCVINPLIPNTCICQNGKIGRKLPGFKGKCVCQDNQINKISNYIHDFTDDLLDQQFRNLPGDFISTFDEKKKYQSQLDNFFYKRHLFKNVENVIPYKNIGNFSFY